MFNFSGHLTNAYNNIMAYNRGQALGWWKKVCFFLENNNNSVHGCTLLSILLRLIKSCTCRFLSHNLGVDFPKSLSPFKGSHVWFICCYKWHMVLETSHLLRS